MLMILFMGKDLLGTDIFYFYSYYLLKCTIRNVSWLNFKQAPQFS